VAASRLAFLAITGITIEDSLISLRYAENLAGGQGLVYNPGEVVFGASTPLHVLLLALLVKLGLPALAIVKGLAVAADVATFRLWAARLEAEAGRPALLAFTLLFALSPVMVPVAVSGMETSFALWLLSLVLLTAVAPPDPARERRREWLLGLWLGLLTLVRPEGVLAGVVVLGLRWHATRRLPWRPALTAAAVVAPWVAVATAYYGTPIPHSIPAKAAAYNLHRPSWWPNLWGTLAELAPIRGPWWRQLVAGFLAPCVAYGLWRSLRDARLRPLGCLFLVWWAYLVVPKTLLFTWYFPLLLLPAYGLAALGLGLALRTPAGAAAAARRGAAVRGTAAVFAAGLVISYGASAHTWRRFQTAEHRVRRAIGLWLAENTPPDARIALEPIGYIGYYSRRRILDEVGLVSPEMVPLNRAGAGWFAAMLRLHAPAWVVERPGYLIRNRTLNSGVPMFADLAEREAFLADYEAVASFQDPDTPNAQDYRFTIYRRRSEESARQWGLVTAGLSREERADLTLRALLGPLPRERARPKVGRHRPDGPPDS
jgi:hypothetical protein